MKAKHIVILAALLLVISCKSEKKDEKAHAHTHKEKQAPKATTDNTGRKTYQYNHIRTGGMKWLTIEEGINLERPSSKKYIIDIYTEWCSWCKVMDKKTFTDPAVQKHLKENFNIIKFDAESKIDVKLNDVMYKWKEDGRNGIHTLAAKLMEGQISYPTMVFLDENMNPIRVARGYKNAEQTIQELEIVTRS